MLICTLDTFFEVFAVGFATPIVLIAIVAFWPSKKETPNGRD